MRNSNHTSEIDAKRELVLFTKVDQLLAEGSPNSALDILTRQKDHSPRVRNAIGVCQMRMGNAKNAFDIFRQLAGSGVHLRPDAPIAYKVNLATALLLLGNEGGCKSILMEIAEEENPAVQRLRRAIKDWRASLSFWQKVQLLFGTVHQPITLVFAPGEIDMPELSPS